MQKTAYELRISDWSSDVCSSDLLFLPLPRPVADSRQDRAAAAAADEHQQAGPEGRRRPGRPRGRERRKGVMRKSFVAALAASVLGLSVAAHAAENAPEPPEVDWSFDGIFATYARAAVQSGPHGYTEVCTAWQYLTQEKGRRSCRERVGKNGVT